MFCVFYLQRGVVWGAAYELVGKEMIKGALDHLGMRECLLGGYISLMTPFYERSATNKPRSVLVFTATPANSLFLGAAPLDALAKQVISCSGPCGHNIQYVTRLANYMTQHIPEEKDPHLFGLVKAIEDECAKQCLDMDTLIEQAKSGCNRVSKNTVCAQCNALCSEYAFCANCRTQTTQQTLRTAQVPAYSAETVDRTFSSHEQLIVALE